MNREYVMLYCTRRRHVIAQTANILRSLQSEITSQHWPSTRWPIFLVVITPLSFHVCKVWTGTWATMTENHLPLWERRCWSFHICFVGAFLRFVASDWPNLRPLSADWSFQGANFSIKETSRMRYQRKLTTLWILIYSPHLRIVPKRSFLVEWSPNPWFFEAKGF